jgi:2-C-methyl-D-erythritol 4-phosphate cytidylyltransferase
MNVALIFAGGTGKRMNVSSCPKQFLTLHGKEIIIHTIEKFENSKDIDAILVVCIEDWIDHLRKTITVNQISKVRWIIPGGSTGQESIRLGLSKLAEECPGDSVVLIHDGVRPLIDESLIRQNIESVLANGSAISASPAIETVIASKDGKVANIYDRKDCYYAKAPQSFFLKDIVRAHETALRDGKDDFIDSASMMRHYGHELSIVECPYQNIKITTPPDYYTFKGILESRENSQIFGL